MILHTREEKNTHVAIYCQDKVYFLLTSPASYPSRNYSTRSTNRILLNVPRVHSELGKTAFSFYAPWAWNELQNTITLETLPSLNNLKGLLKTALKETCCFFM